MSDNSFIDDGTVTDIGRDLARDGCFISSETWTQDRFERTASMLGEVVYEAEVKLGSSRPRNYQLPAEIDFHTDHISAEIVGWYCIEPDLDDGAMQFLDLWSVANGMDEEGRDALQRVRIADNAAWGAGAAVPLCTRHHDRLNFHYVPWLATFPADAQAGAALRQFEASFSALKKTSIRELDVKAGQVVFVDNHRIAHGRRKISGSSKRHLKRVWLKSHTKG